MDTNKSLNNIQGFFPSVVKQGEESGSNIANTVQNQLDNSLDDDKIVVSSEGEKRGVPGFDIVNENQNQQKKDLNNNRNGSLTSEVKQVKEFEHGIYNEIQGQQENNLDNVQNPISSEVKQGEDSHYGAVYKTQNQQEENRVGAKCVEVTEGSSVETQEHREKETQALYTDEFQEQSNNQISVGVISDQIKSGGETQKIEDSTPNPTTFPSNITSEIPENRPITHRTTWSLENIFESSSEEYNEEDFNSILLDVADGINHHLDKQDRIPWEFIKGAKTKEDLNKTLRRLLSITTGKLKGINVGESNPSFQVILPVLTSTVINTSSLITNSNVALEFYQRVFLFFYFQVQG